MDPVPQKKTGYKGTNPMSGGSALWRGYGIGTSGADITTAGPDLRLRNGTIIRPFQSVVVKSKKGKISRDYYAIFLRVLPQNKWEGLWYYNPVECAEAVQKCFKFLRNELLCSGERFTEYVEAIDGVVTVHPYYLYREGMDEHVTRLFYHPCSGRVQRISDKCSSSALQSLSSFAMRGQFNFRDIQQKTACKVLNRVINHITGFDSYHEKAGTFWFKAEGLGLWEFLSIELPVLATFEKDEDDSTFRAKFDSARELEVWLGKGWYRIPYSGGSITICPPVYLKYNPVRDEDHLLIKFGGLDCVNRGDLGMWAAGSAARQEVVSPAPKDQVVLSARAERAARKAAVDKGSGKAGMGGVLRVLGVARKRGRGAHDGEEESQMENGRGKRAAAQPLTGEDRPTPTNIPNGAGGGLLGVTSGEGKASGKGTHSEDGARVVEGSLEGVEAVGVMGAETVKRGLLGALSAGEDTHGESGDKLVGDVERTSAAMCDNGELDGDGSFEGPAVDILTGGLT